ncbi:MAG: acyl-CoA dehydrogenase family protein [Myxococcota bacterium]
MKTSPFNQSAPELANQFDDDTALRALLKHVIPHEQHEAIEADLRETAEACAALDALSAEDRANEPTLTQWDAWGERIDRIELTKTWHAAERVAAERGIVAAAYENRFGDSARVHQFASAYLFAPASDFFGCPLAMTDGAARTLLASGHQALIERAVPHLTSRDPAEFWTSGQWMTESAGGSDVGRSETVAVKGDGTWKLSGRKWFTSAAASQMALTLGRPEGNPEGGHGLALFYVECDAQRGKTILINRLKEKLGTKKLPTAELTLDDAEAHLVTGTSGGVKAITPMLNVTRTWNAVTSVALMRRGLALAKDYARRRVAFGAPLSEQPLHVDTLAGLQAEFEGALHLAFRIAALLGEVERGDEQNTELLRTLTPIAKLTTGKQVVAVNSEVLEAFGGAGYVEDTGLPRLLRDAQVLPIWEGTTNVLALDLLRALHRGNGLEALHTELNRCLAGAQGALEASAALARRQFNDASEWLAGAQHNRQRLEGGARRFALTLGRTFELALLVRFAQDTASARAAAVAARFARHPMPGIYADESVSAILA